MNFSIPNLKSAISPQLFFAPLLVLGAFGCSPFFSVACADEAAIRFSNTVSKYASPQVRFLSAGDLNGDGLTDLLTINTTASSGSEVLLRAALGDGSGSFSLDANLFGGNPPLLVSPKAIVGDFNLDRIPDVAIYDGGTYDWSVRVTRGRQPIMLQGIPSGGFVRTSALTDPLTPYIQPQGPNYNGGYQIDHTVGIKDFDAADIDGDGDLDLWIEATGSANITSHFMINSNGRFTVDLNNRISRETLFGPKQTDYYRYGIGRFVDLNKDGRPDLLLGQIRDNDITHIDQSSFVLVNDGRGFYPLSSRIRLPTPNFYHGYTSVQCVADFDFDKDGRNDLVLVHTRNDDVSGPEMETAWTGTYVQFLRQNSVGSFDDETVLRVGDQSLWSNAGITQFAIDCSHGDVDRDGLEDLILRYHPALPDSTRPNVLLNTKNGLFRPISPSLIFGNAASGGNGLLPIDVNADGYQDFLSWGWSNGMPAIFGHLSKDALTPTPTAAPTYPAPNATLKVTIAKGNGSITSSPEGIECGATCSYPFTKKMTIKLTATPADGAKFGGWSGACTGKKLTCSVKLSGNKSVKAKFN